MIVGARLYVELHPELAEAIQVNLWNITSCANDQWDTTRQEFEEGLTELERRLRGRPVAERRRRGAHRLPPPGFADDEPGLISRDPKVGVAVLENVLSGRPPMADIEALWPDGLAIPTELGQEGTTTMRERAVQREYWRLKRRGDFSAAEQLVNDWARESGKEQDHFSAAYMLWTFALDEGLLDKALHYALEMTRLYGEDGSSLGLTYRLRGELSEAEAALRRGIRLQLEEAAAQEHEDDAEDIELGAQCDATDLATVLMEQGKLDEAEAVALSGLELLEDHADALPSRLETLGRIYRRKGNFPKAIDYLRCATRLFRHGGVGSSLVEELAATVREAEGQGSR